MPYDFWVNITITLILGFYNKLVENHSKSSYIYINGRIRLEHTKLFDKWRNCYTPSIHLPETKEDFNNLIKLMDYVGSDEFFNFFETPKDHFSYHDSGVESINELYGNLEHLFDYNLNLWIIPIDLYIWICNNNYVSRLLGIMFNEIITGF